MHAVARAVQVTRDEWLAAAKDDLNATFFHTPDWADIWRDYARYVPEAWQLTFDDGQNCILPLSVRPKSFLRPATAQLSAAGTYGGPLGTELQDVHYAAIWQWLKMHFKAVQWRQNAYAKTEMPQDGNRADHTRRLELGQGFESIYRLWTKGHKHSARRAEKMGYTTRLAADKDAWQNYYAVYQKTLARWGAAKRGEYTQKLFTLLASSDQEHVKLWLSCDPSSAVAAGAVCFYWQKKVIYWHGAADQTHFKNGIVNKLIGDVIRNACEDGHEWFDFNPSGRLTSVDSFKKSFGSETAPAGLFLHEPALLGIVRSLWKK